MEGGRLEQVDGVGVQVELLQAHQPPELMLTHLGQVTAPEQIVLEHCWLQLGIFDCTQFFAEQKLHTGTV